MGIYYYRVFQDSSDFENVSWLSPKGPSDHMTWLVFGKRGRCRAGGTHSHPRPLHGSPEHSRHRRQTAGLTDRTEERDLLVPSVRHIPRPGPPTQDRLSVQRLRLAAGRAHPAAAPGVSTRPGRGIPGPDSLPGLRSRKAAPDSCAGARCQRPRGRSGLTLTSRRRRPSSSSSRPRSPAWSLPPAEWPALTLWFWSPRPCAAGPARVSPAGRKVRGPDPPARGSPPPHTSPPPPRYSHLQHRLLLLLSRGHEDKERGAHASPRAQKGTHDQRFA